MHYFLHILLNTFDTLFWINLNENSVIITLKTSCLLNWSNAAFTFNKSNRINAQPDCETASLCCSMWFVVFLIFLFIYWQPETAIYYLSPYCHQGLLFENFQMTVRTSFLVTFLDYHGNEIIGLENIVVYTMTLSLFLRNLQLISPVFIFYAHLCIDNDLKYSMETWSLLKL